MSELTSALGRIATWYWENKPESHPAFQPGLSCTDVDELLTDLRFPVPHDVYEVYKWCNGSGHVPIAFDGYCLMSLKWAAGLRKDEYGLNYGDFDILPDDPSWFPMFKFRGENSFYIVVLGDKDKSPVRLYDTEFRKCVIYYENLTNMLMHCAEWLESSHYFEDKNLWEVDRKIDARLQVKYRVHESIHKDDLKWAESDEEKNI